MRRTIIGAIGGDFEDAGPDALAFGAAVARAGCILLTGGEPSNRREVKSATMQGGGEFWRDGTSSRISPSITVGMATPIANAVANK